MKLFPMEEAIPTRFIVWALEWKQEVKDLEMLNIILLAGHAFQKDRIYQ